MHMWMWFGYDLGEFLFPGLNITERWQFTITWLVLFVVALLYEGSKVYLANVQRQAQKKLFPGRCDDKRNLLYDRLGGVPTEPTTSRDASIGQVRQNIPFGVRMSMNAHQTLVFLLHNVVGYLLMLAVMVYNVHLLLAVVFGMMLGYFLFGTKLTRLQMQCFGTKRVVICTPECDDTAEGTTPPLLNSHSSDDSEYFVCQTRTCVQPSHYFRANAQDGCGSSNASCHYGAKRCPSRVARANKINSENISYQSKEESPPVEDSHLLQTERTGCCKKKKDPPSREQTSHCGKAGSEKKIVSCCKRDVEIISEQDSNVREESPQIGCCSKPVLAESQEKIIR